MCSAIVTKQNCNFLVPILNLIYRSHGADGRNRHGRCNGPHGADGRNGHGRCNGSHGADGSGRHGRCDGPYGCDRCNGRDGSYGSHGTDGCNRCNGRDRRDGNGGNFGASFRLFDAVGARYGRESSALRCERRIVGYGYHSYGGQRRFFRARTRYLYGCIPRKSRACIGGEFPAQRYSRAPAERYRRPRGGCPAYFPHVSGYGHRIVQHAC